MIPKGELQAPITALPEGFPDPDPPIRALHQGKLIALLRPRDDGWGTVANLRGGL
jgi:tRNA pseudouridine55 synthase